MEKLIYSTTQCPSKLHHQNRSHPLLPTRIRHVDFKLPSLLRLESRRVNSLSIKCSHDSSSSFSGTQNGYEENPFVFPGSAYGSGSKTHFLKLIGERISQQNKVMDNPFVFLKLNCSFFTRFRFLFWYR